MSYEIKKGGVWQDARNGPKLDKFNLALMEVNDYIEIPLRANKKGKRVPEAGFNLKAANEIYAPAVFKKRRDAETGVIIVQRVK